MKTNSTGLIGHIGNEVTNEKIGEKHLTKFTFATSERYKDKQGVLQTITEWHRITLWNRPNLGAILTKGMLLAVEGKLHYDSYDHKTIKDDAGKPFKVQTTEIIADSVTILSKKKDEDVAPTEE